MAKTQEIELLADGIEAINPVKGSFALNMLNRNGSWHVRKGFGQLAEFDTTMMRNISSSSTVSWAYEKHLGSKLIRTSFGHEQIVSVVHGFFATGGATGEVFTAAEKFAGSARDTSPTKIYHLYLVSIFDVTTGERWEEPLYRHTSSNRSLPLYELHAQYETNLTRDYQTFINSEASDYVWFEHAADTLFFGNENMAVWYYTPTSFRSTRTQEGDAPIFQQLDDHCTFEWSIGRGETCLIKNIAPSPGQFKNVLPYLETSIFEAVVDMTFLNGTYVYATKDTLYFSDVGKAGSILSANSAFLSLGNVITAIEAFKDQIYIFTENETWVFTPIIVGELLTGKLTQLSNETGCLSPNAIILANNILIWVDINGVHSTNGGQSINIISGVVENFFKRYITNPLNNWYTQSGALGSQTPVPSITMKLNPNGIHLAYSATEKLLLMVMPETNQILTLSDGDNWSLWTTETLVNNPGVPTVQITDNIQNPWMVTSNTSMFLVGGTNPTAWLDSTVNTETSTQVDDDALISSYYILEYGRGGGLDRSIRNEDYRNIIGKWFIHNSNKVPVLDPLIWPLGKAHLRDNGTVYIDRLIKQEVFSNTPIGQAPAASYILPIQLVPPLLSETVPPSAPSQANNLATDVGYRVNITNFAFTFWFDNTNWRPVFYTSTPGGTWDETIISPVPNERGYVSNGYANFPDVALPVPNGGVSEVQCYNSVTGLPDVNGDQVHINWAKGAALAIGTWNYKSGAGGAQDTLNLNPDMRNPMLFLTFTYIGSGDVTSMGIIPIEADTNISGQWTTSINLAVDVDQVTPSVVYWQQAHSPNLHKENSTAQAVDWAYKSTQVGLDNDVNFKARGLSTIMKSHGKSTNPLHADWWAGLYNTLGGSDWKEWTSQTIDLDATNETPVALQTVLDKTTVRNRFSNAAGSLSTRTFGNTDILWDDGSGTVGNYLVDEQEVNKINTSDNIRGEWISYMAFGHIQDKAEELVLVSLKAVIRPIAPGRRKTGH